MPFDDYDDAISRVNATEYGLGGSVWGADEEKALEIAQRITSGTVWINESQNLSPLAAFGGMRQSGIGVEGGLQGLLEYTSSQTIMRHKSTAPAG